MFTTVEQFEQAWNSHLGDTKKILSALTEESLRREVAVGHRTLGRMAWHIVTTIPEMMARTGLEVKSVAHDASVPETASQIQEAYAAVTSELLEQVRQNWKNRDLLVEDDMYGEKWKRGYSLYVLMNHEIHHRGQMTVLLRQAGLKVPGIYGPSKEEWSQYGMKEPAV